MTQKDLANKKVLPVLPLRGLPVFPYMIIHFDIGRDISVSAIEEAMVDNQLILLLAQKDPDVEDPTEDDLYDAGTVAKIKQILKLPSDEIRILVEGIYRAKVERFVSHEPYFECEVSVFSETQDDNDMQKLTKEAYMRKIKSLCNAYFSMSGKVQRDVIDIFSNITEPDRLADIVCANLFIELDDKQRLLAEFDTVKRLEMLTDIISNEIEIKKIEIEINAKVKNQIDKSQKDYYLREQLKVIQDELGDEGGATAEADSYRERFKDACVPEKVMEKAEKEISKLVKMQSGNPEANVIRNYLDTLLDIPWSNTTKENYDIKNAQKILDEDHYGLKRVKERITEYLAVKALKNDVTSPIICLVGPPGVGKTSIAKSIARATGRNYARMSLGGVRDEAEIRGHRRTYIGAMPGRIINALIQAKSANPLILLDEIDKIGSDFKGDPSSALLEVLDGEQNSTFRDHFVSLAVDLSKVLFVTTANTLDSIDRPLLDRMEIIEVPGYTDEDKLNIAEKYLIPKQLEKHGLKKSNVRMGKAALLALINGYTREAGVRNLEREIAHIMRKCAKMIIEEGTDKVSVKSSNLEQFLGRKPFSMSEMNKKDETGVATGLAWTSVGGDTLFIEVNTMDGTGKTELTGSLGDVMKESARAAISYIRANAGKYKIDKEFYKNKDIHIHVPEGATPKDGPSAGITMATALISALTGSKVRKDVAMTGEITLRGRVLPIGGLREKALAAYRAGIRTIIIPHENEKDLEDIPENIREDINFVPVRYVGEVIKVAFSED